MKIENVINLVAVAVIAAHIGRKQQLKKDIQEVTELFTKEVCDYKQQKYRTSHRSYADKYGAKSTNYEFYVATREEGEKVLDEMKNLIDDYACASVGDLLELVGLKSTYLDDRIGWTSVKGMTLRRSAKYGYSLVFPNPTILP